MSEEKRAPYIIDGYSVGDQGKPEHFEESMSREDAANAAKVLRVGDAAFIKRSDLKWTYALLTDRNEDGAIVTLRFDVDQEKNRKSFPEHQWGKYIRVIKMSAVSKPKENSENEVPSTPKPAEKPVTEVKETPRVSNVTSPEAEEKAAPVEEKKEDPAATAAAPVSEAPATAKAPEQKPPTSAKKSEKSGWFSSFFGSPARPPSPVPPSARAPSPAPSAVPTRAPTPPLVPDAAVGAIPDVTANTSAISELTDQRTITNEKELTKPITPKKTPSSILKTFKFSKSRSKLTTPKAGDSSSATDKDTKKDAKTDEKKVEWFDPEALECDYDKNPTDLFQALEARQFDYAEEMYQNTNKQFLKDCRTWVIARGKANDKTLRFRALPLHAAIVFGAKEDMVKKIIKAYPKAARGRDVKGRLPIHLAYEHDVSDEIVSLLVEEFPKGFIAKDKKDMTPIDHIKDGSSRAHLKKFIPQVFSVKIEDEREKWEVEMNKKLEEQKVNLKSDEEYMADVVEHVHDELQAQHASIMKDVEEKHDLAIIDLKRKHAAEIKSLLEGFEVKLNFEKKLNRIKGTETLDGK